MRNSEKPMYEKMAKINGLEMETGVGRALFDNPVNPTKRYFLEKRWDTGDKVFGAIMMNPSKAGALEGDKTVDGLIKLAKAKNFSALYVVNIIPYICSNPKHLPDNIKEMVMEPEQLRSMELVLNESETILLAWGKKGHEYLPDLLSNKKTKDLLIKNNYKCKFVKLNITKKFPVHPRPRGIDKYKLDELGDKFEFKDAAKELEKWINNYSI